MDNYTSQRRNYYGGNGNRNVRSSNGSYNNRNSYNSFNGVNGRYNNNRNNGYNGYNGGRYNNNRSISYNSYYSRNSSDDRSDRMETFAAYDNVYRTEIATEETEDYDDIPIGVAYIIFKPVPNHPFWDHPLKFHSFPAESLEMGDYLQSGTFVSEAKFTQSVEFTINHQRRKIIVEFAAKEYQEKIRMFKLEINFKDLMNDIYSELDASQRRSRGSITIENKYPAKYWVLDESKKPKDRFNWCINDTWKRITEINTSNNDNEIPLFHQNNEQPVNGLSLG
ncbi:hypothetical protein GLOIN_2v1645269 [Rhizophagus clarus]|uniref:Uncharacterized protein n=1 Tax=Rhizophagus clarus TaxID=94130 RepID=A0A8H3QBY2_9GLOM|nr:hypothetical protein GLOIN_2v1645269 [Rhizophagus clarus]